MPERCEGAHKGKNTNVDKTTDIEDHTYLACLVGGTVINKHNAVARALTLRLRRTGIYASVSATDSKTRTFVGKDGKEEPGDVIADEYNGNTIYIDLTFKELSSKTHENKTMKDVLTKAEDAKTKKYVVTGKTQGTTFKPLAFTGQGVPSTRTMKTIRTLFRITSAKERGQGAITAAQEEREEGYRKEMSQFYLATSKECLMKSAESVCNHAGGFFLNMRF